MKAHCSPGRDRALRLQYLLVFAPGSYGLRGAGDPQGDVNGGGSSGVPKEPPRWDAITSSSGAELRGLQHPVDAERPHARQVFRHASALWSVHLFPLGVELVREAVALAVDPGLVPSQPQDDKLATWEPSFGAAPVYRPELLELTAG